MKKRKSAKKVNKSTLQPPGWRDIVLTETKETKGVDTQKILREIRYGK